MSRMHEAFEVYANQLFQYAYHSLGSREDAKDIVQDVFERAVRAEFDFLASKAAHPTCATIRRDAHHA